MMPMTCRRAEELLSESWEGRLTGPLQAEMDAHLEACDACRRLRDALEEVVAALASEPVPEPSEHLARRAAAAALARSRRARLLGWRPRWTRATWLRAAAAAVVIGSGISLLTTGDPGRALSRLYGRGVAFGARVVERAERILDDVRVLKVRASAAFAGSLDRMNDRRDEDRSFPEGPESFSEPVPTPGVRGSAGEAGAEVPVASTAGAILTRS